MSEPDPKVVDAVREWVRYAEDDLRYARQGLAMEDCPFRLVCYHAQQCVEKYLKGYLVLRGADFPYTHDIDRLLSICSSVGVAIDGLTDAVELTPFAVTARYPGRSQEVARSHAERAVEIAERVRERVRGLLSDAGMGDLP